MKILSFLMFFPFLTLNYDAYQHLRHFHASALKQKLNFGARAHPSIDF